MILIYKIYGKYDLLKSLEKVSSGESLEGKEIKVEKICVFKDLGVSLRIFE